VLDPDGPGDARELVGKRAGGLVVMGAVLHRERPGSEAIEFSTRATVAARRTDLAPWVRSMRM
jgi:hypothetical protein